MDRDLLKKLGVGCLGALSPIIANLMVVDMRLVLTNATFWAALSYFVRQLALCIAACIVVYLNRDEKKLARVFQLGIVAPALLTGMINGVSLSANLPAQANVTPPANVKSQSTIEMPSTVSSAIAQPVVGNTSPTEAVPQPKDCLKRESSVSQEILRGLLSILPENRWYVVISSNINLRYAVNHVQEIRRKYEGKFQAEICQPLPGDNRYRIVIGENLTRTAAEKLQQEAVEAGFPPGTWLWSPLQAVQ